MQKKEVIRIMQQRIDTLNRSLPLAPTKQELEECITRTDEIRNIANLLGGLDMELD